MSKILKELMDLLEARNLHPAMRPPELLDKAKNEGNELHPLVLCPTRNNPALIYIHPERLLQELDKRGEFLNMTTLKFEKKPVEEPKPEPETKPEKELEPCPMPDPDLGTIPEEPKPTPPGKEPEQTPEPEPEPEKPIPKETYTAEEVEAMEWDMLRKVAKADPDVPGNKSKDKLKKLLVGRPKFPLE